MEIDKKLLVSKGDLIFWIFIFTAMVFFVGMFVSAGFDLRRIDAKIEATIKKTEQEQKRIEELMRKIDEISNKE